MEKEVFKSAIETTQIQSDSWRDYELLRHEMLESDPEAFPPVAFEDLNDGEGVWRRRIDAGPVLITYDRGRPIGMVRATIEGQTAVIRNMYTNKDYRGKGIAKQMMDKLLRTLSSTSVKVLELEVEDTQIAARTMYETGFGFEETRRVPNERGGAMITMKRYLLLNPI